MPKNTPEELFDSAYRSARFIGYNADFETVYIIKQIHPNGDILTIRNGDEIVLTLHPTTRRIINADSGQEIPDLNHPRARSIMDFRQS